MAQCCTPSWCTARTAARPWERSAKGLRQLCCLQGLFAVLHCNEHECAIEGATCPQRFRDMLQVREEPTSTASSVPQIQFVVKQPSTVQYIESINTFRACRCVNMLLMEELMNAFSVPGQVPDLEDGSLVPPHSPPDLQQGVKGCLGIKKQGISKRKTANDSVARALQAVPWQTS